MPTREKRREIERRSYKKHATARREQQRQRRENNPEKNREINRRSYARHATARREQQRRWQKENAPHVLARGRRQRGLPAATRPSPALCECCGSSPGKRALNLDHCHITGDFRGWLCNRCNRGIGLLGDDLRSILRAAAYLQRNDTFADLLGDVT